MGLVGAPVQGASPYPPSSLITGITRAPDGSLPTAWGAGTIRCTEKASHGVAMLASAQPGTALTTLHCGPGPTSKGKLMALLASGDGLFARFGPQGTVTGFSIWKSSNEGRTLWPTFSCHRGSLPKTCGVYRDRLNLMRARLTVR